MKKILTFNFQLSTVLLFAALVIFNACGEETIGQQPEDSVAPGEVIPLPPKSVPGGAVVYYVLPTDEDLLYVKAVYSLQDGIERDAKASVYTDSLEILGFGDVSPHKVQLIAVDRSRNESKPVAVTIEPLTPPVMTIGESLWLREDFGGLHAFWDNPLKAKISVPVLVKDQNDDYVPLETFYSESAAGEGTVRGMDTIPVDVMVYVQDRWGNRSEAKAYTLTPIYEMLFDRWAHSIIHLDTDASPHDGTYAMENMFNGDKNAEKCAATNNDGNWPQTVTIDIGFTAKISRLRIYQRGSGYYWIMGALRNFEVYGRADIPPQNGDWDGWTLLADCESKKPSGLPLGEINDDDVALAENGEDFPIPISAEPVRYLRIKATKTWGNARDFYIGELEIYGDNR
jgi:hypothetical protein